MSISRQANEPQVRTFAITCSSGYTWHSRMSGWGQVVYAARGMMTLHTDHGLWVVPPHQAVWVPLGVRHDIEMMGAVALRAVYLHAGLRRRLPVTCRMVEVSPLLRELLRRAIRLGTLDRRRPAERDLLRVLLNELAFLPLAPVDLPLPRDPRGLRAATALRQATGKRHTLDALGRYANASPRTLQRLFRAETGLSLGTWAQRARMLQALQLLADGRTVTQAGIGVGYESTSAFVSAFRRSLGTTPGQYFHKGGAEQENGLQRESPRRPVT